MSNEQRTAVHGTKEQLAAALHTVTVERDALRQQFDGNAELCVICGELCSSYAGNPNKWPVRLGNDSWRHIGCVNKQLAERDALRQALEEARQALNTINIVSSPNPERTMVPGASQDLGWCCDESRRALARIDAILKAKCKGSC